jgi:acetyl-CoA synthetase
VHRTRPTLFTFAGYWRADTPSFRGEWYLTGDTMQQDADGHFYFIGRTDDIINSAGYRIGPFEVESAMMEHPAVAEVAVVHVVDQCQEQMLGRRVLVVPLVGERKRALERLL